MGAKPSKSVDLRRSFPTCKKKRIALGKKKANGRSVSSVSATKPLCSNNHLVNIPLDTNQLPKKSTENEIAKTTSDPKQTSNMCNNNNDDIDSGKMKPSSPNKNTCSFASNTIDSRHVSLSTTSDIGMHSNKSGLSSDCWTTLSSDPFSQIEVNTSTFTEITDQSTISRIPIIEHQYIHSSPDIFATTTQEILNKLNSHPTSVHLVLNEAYHRAQEQNDVNDWAEFYRALDQYISQPTTPVSSRNSATVYLAKCFLFGLGAERNIEHGLHLLASHPSCETTYALGKYYLDSDQRKAFECIKSASEYAITNDSQKTTVSEAQCTLARLLFQGEGVAQNPSQALHYLIKSAENDNMYAQFLMGVHFERGIEIERNLEKAKFYYRKSAISGFPDAQAALGSRLIAESKYSEGVEWLEKAVQKGNSRAHVQLGILYDKGQGVPQNNDMALLHYKVATESSNPAAQYILGLVYYFGRLGRQKNYKDAIRLIKQSAMAGFPFAQRVLGQLYQRSNIILDTPTRNNNHEAIRWFRRASSNGDIAALGILGRCFEVGKGVEVDLKKALAYYAKAAETNSPYLCNAFIDQARILQKMSRHTEAFLIYNKVLINGNSAIDPRTIQTAECSIARYYLCRDIQGIEYNPSLAYTMLLKLTETSNDPLAHYWLGSIFDEGIPSVVEIQRQKAYHHFVIAAEAGDNDATFLVAYMLSNYVIPEKGPSEAFPWYQKAAMNGHPMSMYSLGLCYYKGIGQNIVLALALEWFEKALKYGVKDAVPYIAKIYLKQAAIRADEPQIAQRLFGKAIAALKIGVENDDTYSQRELAKIYLKRKCVNSDNGLTIGLLQKAATKDDPEALISLGDCYQKGVCVEKDIDAAIDHYSRAADLDYPYAYPALAELYYQIGDLVHAYKYYTLASKNARIVNSDTDKTVRMMIARLALGDLPEIRNNPSIFQHLLNSNTTISAALAFEVLSTLAIQESFALSFQPLACCYLYGNGTEVNRDKAFFWLEQAATDHNNDAAYFHLAHVYTSLDYLNKSAEMGYTEAQFKLGMVYLNGEYGVYKDECIAASWFERAVSGSHSESAWMLSQIALQVEVELQYLKTAASFGHVLAMRVLGQKYLKLPYSCLKEALNYLKMAGDANDTESLLLLGKTYKAETKTTEQDETLLAIDCFKKASNLSNVEASVCAGEILYEQGEYVAAFELFDKAASHGHVLAQFLRARYYLEGQAGCPSKNPEKGFKELLLCANDLNCIYAYFTVGQCYENGIGTIQDNHRAYEWYIRAEDAEAYYRIGLIFADNRLYAKNLRMEALRYFKNAKNHGLSCYHLGMYYLNGIAASLLPNTRLSIEYFKTAADSNVSEAMSQLGLLWLLNDSSFDEGLAYLHRAADLRHCDAQFELGLFYYHENDSDEKAYDLFSRSEAQGHPAATYYVGIYYHHGIFVSLDPSTALEQYQLAVELFETCETAPHRWMAEYNLARLRDSYKLLQAAHAHAPNNVKVLLKIMITKHHLHTDTEQAVSALLEFAKDTRFDHSVYFELAQYFENGIGVAQNLRQAFHWYGEVLNYKISGEQILPFVNFDESMEQEQGVAMFKLGEFYRNGVVVKPDFRKVNDLRRLAAQKGCLEAQSHMLKLCT